MTIAWIIIAILDIFNLLTCNGYQGSLTEWIGYSSVSLAIYYGWILIDKDRLVIRNTLVSEQAHDLHDLAENDINELSWREFTNWLTTDASSDSDFFNRRPVADRTARLITQETRSIGIVGDFGSGKSTIVQWVQDQLEEGNHSGHKNHLVCHHSCWGFETSSSAIQQLLQSAINKLQEEIDTFDLRLLPDPYHKIFTVSEGWSNAVSSVLFNNMTIEDYFKHLSELLEDSDTRLIFIIEDLDRNQASTFDPQEVLAFLERLKVDHTCKNIRFIITGGRTSPNSIGYAKLCDHIEYLTENNPHHVRAIALKLIKGCYDPVNFSDEFPDGPDVSLQNFSHDIDEYLRDIRLTTLSESIARLLRTPRAFRHAFGRTYTAWKELHGEIYLNDLLAFNVLRFGAPECFDFVIRWWDRLKKRPNRREISADNLERIKQTIKEEWKVSVANAEWDPIAALDIVKCALPEAIYWLQEDYNGGGDNPAIQGISNNRYWNRAFSESINKGDIKDQTIIADMRTWFKEPKSDNDLIVRLTSDQLYGQAWRGFAMKYLQGNTSSLLDICTQIIQRTLIAEGPAASNGSIGFYVAIKIIGKPDSEFARDWLVNAIRESSKTSLSMVLALWSYFGKKGDYCILGSEIEIEQTRQDVIRVLQDNIDSAQVLNDALLADRPETLYELMLALRQQTHAEDDTDRHSNLDISEWMWIATILTEALKLNDSVIPTAIAYLISPSGNKGPDGGVIINIETFFGLFEDNAQGIVDLMETHAPRVVPEMYRQFVQRSAQSARRVLESQRTDGFSVNDVSE